ncbi:hypothetical protein GOV05_05265 [Candidatus Woesearchaeota archaeon]|nr:hypothetical protein [Candidatus Woesearchaeota archaeon]
MAGLLSHVIAGLSTGLILHVLHQRFEFSVVAFIGNLLPDVIKFGVGAVFAGTINVFRIRENTVFRGLGVLSDNFTNWLSLGFVILSVLVFLYHYHYLKKKRFEEYSELAIILLLGVLTHLLMDYLIIESTPWI